MDVFKQDAANHRSIPKRSLRRFLVKTAVCICLVVGCAVIKSNSQTAVLPVWNAVEAAVTGGVDYRSAMEEIGSALQSGESVMPVFRAAIADLFFAETPKAEGGEVVPVVNAADLSIELLSFEMSAEELQDDTSAEPFVLPGATSDTTLDFAHTTPLYGIVTSPFGYRNHPILQSRSFHTGIDIAGAMGDPIGSFADGTVLEVGYNNIYGNYILIAHGDTYRSFYGHSSKILVRQGQTVSIGQTIAEVGTTGLSTGPHLHFEVRRGNTRLDPAQFIIPNP